MPGALGSIVTGFARRDKCWVSGCWLETLQATSLHCSSAVASPCCFQNRRAASLLGSLGDVVAGFARRRGCWVRQAASLLGSSGGVVAGLVRRRRCRVRQARQLSGFLDVPPSALRAPPPVRCAHGGRDFVVRLRRYWLRRRRYWARQVASILSLSSEVVRETLCKNVFIVSASAVNYRHEQNNLPKRYQSRAICAPPSPVGKCP